jgi:hypothetical protein
MPSSPARELERDRMTVGPAPESPHAAGPAPHPGDPRLDALTARLARKDLYQMSTVFPRTAGMGSGRDIKRRARMLASVEPRLDLLLYPGERIEFVTTAVLNSLAEQYFMGLWAIVINRTLMLFTQHRVILIQADGKGRARHLAWQIPYSRLQGFKTGMVTSSARFKLEDGKVYKFAQMPRHDRKLLRAFMEAQTNSGGQAPFEFPSHSPRDPLCPACCTPLPARARVCAECDEHLVDPRLPALMSCIVPGTGHLYLGHRGLGLVELAGFCFLLLAMVALIIENPSEWWIAPVIIAIFNTMDGLITLHVARKGMLSRRQTFGRNPHLARGV